MARYLRIDINSIDNWIIEDEYENEKELLDETDNFYHETCYYEEGYNENKSFVSVEQCAELWRGSDYLIAKVIEE